MQRIQTRRIIRNKRGTEKPIEIFVALFIILAVALAMLKLFQGQLTQRTEELSKLEQEGKIKEMKQDLQLACSEKCTQASNNGCSRQSLAALCLANSDDILSKEPFDFIDLNGNNKNDLNTEEFGGEGVCEDKIYCFNYGINCCARKLDFATCAGILNSYWEEKGWGRSSTERGKLCNTVLNKGNCETTDADFDDKLDFAWWSSSAWDTVCGS